MMQKKRKFRTASQLLLIGLLTASTTLPGFTTAISVSADEAIHQESETTRLLKEEGDIASGISGSSKWRIDSTGILHFQPGMLGEDKEWSRYSSQINKIIFEGNIQPPENLKGYFSSLWNVKNIEGLYRLDTSNVTDMSSMFKGMSSLTSLDLSGLDTSNVTDMSSMFEGMSSLTSLDLSGLDTSNVTNMSSMFKNMSSLTSLDLSGLDTSNVTNMSSMFENMSSLTSLDLSGLDTSNVTNMSSMFEYMSSLTSLDLSGLDTSNVTDMSSMFQYMSSLTSLDLSGLDTSNVVEMGYMFYYVSSLTSLDLSGFDTSNVVGMGHMFRYMSSLTSLDLSGFDTSNVVGMGYMFSDMSSLTSLDLSGFDTSNVDRMGGMFSRMSSLSSLDLTSFNTSKVRSMYRMFHGTPSLTEIDVSSFDTSNVVDMGDMFSGSGLESLNLSNFDTSKMGYSEDESFHTMFRGMNSLRSIDISSFKANSVVLDNPSLSQITLGPDIGSVFLKSIPVVGKYSGKWINVGKGTVEVPKGVNVWTSSEFLRNYDGSKHADTYVWQKDLTAVNVHDSTLQVGDTWTAEDNFDSAMTSDGYDVKFKDISVTGEVDTSQTGKYPIQYSYNGVTETATVAVNDATTIQGGDVTVHYQDTEGNTISDDVVLKGNVGESYTSEKKSIKGYTYKEIKGDASGKFKDEAQTVTYIYTKDPAVVQGGNVTVQYQDESGKSIADSVTLKGDVGKTYTSTKKSISNYTYKETKGNATGKFTAKPQTVTYIYKKNATTTTPNKQETVNIYRLYNKKSQEHIYTSDKNEYTTLPKISKDWVREGINFKGYKKSSSTTVAVRRVYNPKSGEHLTTTDAYEVKVLKSKGWKDEGVSFYAPKTGGIPVYRLYNPKAGLGAHFVTADGYEKKVLTTAPKEWKYEGIAWRSVK
ncbi:BspA family leucine-rich repeat surface protein [Lactococcus garvieae]|uniref:BspA family leucine-rich repeat surface protein n=1 Tax=Lactococcus garvieae TaxID=1363 RepID=A0AA46TVW4_9LACT|nr:BspA family leucine-rich repeat surface protein [Lactococcus garvieae]UYT10353.1 BspA family leucine-rich repeat surface protein [Lactococcus garvieae]UYT12392.1 BspA family leucine-rich repeat surface protein [Lactococcus garvieae]